MTYGDFGPVPDPYEVAVLQALRVGLRHTVAGEFVQDATRFEAHWDYLAHHMLVSIETKVLAEALPPETVTRSERLDVETPATWWQHFKADHPRIAARLRLRPVRMTTVSATAHMSVSLQRYWAYPDAKRLPEARFGRPVRIAIPPDISTWLRDVA